MFRFGCRVWTPNLPDSANPTGQDESRTMNTTGSHDLSLTGYSRIAGGSCQHPLGTLETWPLYAKDQKGEHSCDRILFTPLYTILL